MNELIGRRGGGGGGGHGGWHGGWHGARPRRRFQFGGYGGDWGGYGYPYDEVEEVEFAEDEVVSSGVSDGAYALMGQEMRDAVTALSPGAGGMTCDMGLGPDLVLHVSVCVDGRRYHANVDMAKTIASVVDQVSAQFRGAGGGPGVSVGRHHQGQGHHHHHHHHHPYDPQDAAQAASQQADEMIESAGMIVVGQLFDQHCRTVTAGWFDDITKGVSSVADAVQSTIKQFKGPLSVAAGAAAATAATGLGMPFVAPMAAGLAGQLVNAAAGDDHAAASAASAVEAAKNAAINNPNIAAALDSAHKAVAQLTGAYHVAATADRAAAGDPRATQAIQQLHAAANAGDVSARRGIQIAHAVNRAASASPGYARTSYSPAASYVPRKKHRPRPRPAAYRAAARPVDATNIARAALDRLRAEARAAVLDANLQHGDVALGFLKGADGAQVQAFSSSDEADDWLGALDPADFVYAAYFDQSDPTWPAPINESLGAVVQATDDVVSGALPLVPFLFGAAAGGAGYALWNHRQDLFGKDPIRGDLSMMGPDELRRLSESHERAKSGVPITAPVVTSGEIDGARADAIVAAQELHRQANATYIGYVKTRGGGKSDRGDGVVVTVEDTAMAQSFPTFDQLSNWFNRTAESEDYVYLACFDASSEAWPAPIGSMAAPAQGDRGGVSRASTRSSTRVRG
jgi:hypothetical protein